MRETSLSHLALARKFASDARRQFRVGGVEWCVPHIIPPGGLRGALAVVGPKVALQGGFQARAALATSPAACLGVAAAGSVPFGALSAGPPNLACLFTIPEASL